MWWCTCSTPAAGHSPAPPPTPTATTRFDNLRPGAYLVEFEPPTGFEFTIPDAAEDGVDSDADPRTGRSATVNLEGGEHDPTIDAGIVRPVRIGDYVWIDEDRDGIQDDGESGLPDVPVVLLRDGAEVATTQTDADGRYLFDGLRPGGYAVRFVPPVTHAVTTQDVGDDATDSDGVLTPVATVPSGGEDLTLDLGLHLVTVPAEETAGLGDTVWLDRDADGIQDADEPGVPGVMVRLLDRDGNRLARRATDADGRYMFTDLAPGDYVVEFVPPTGYELSPANQGPDALDSDADAVTRRSPVVRLAADEFNPTIDAGLYLPARLGDVVWYDVNRDGTQNVGEPGVVGVSVELLGPDGEVLDTTATDGAGRYFFENLRPGTYAVRFVRPDDRDFTGRGMGDDEEDSDADPDSGLSHEVVLASGDEDLSIDAGVVDRLVTPPRERTLSLGNTVWLDGDNNGRHDADEAGITNVMLHLFEDLDGSGDINGFDRLVASTVTDAEGNYRFDGLGEGAYIVRVPHVGELRSSDPTSGDPNDDRDRDDNGVAQADGSVVSGVVTLEVDTEPVDEDGDELGPDDNLTVDFGFYEPVHIGGDLFADEDLDGEFDPDEAPFSGIAVELYREDQIPGVSEPVATTRSGRSGEYIFEDLPPGTYVVYIPTPPSDWPDSSVPTDPMDNQEPRDDNGMQDIPGGSVHSPPIELVCGEEPQRDGRADLTVGFGFIRPVSVGDRVWFDRDADGVQDADEAGVPGVRVRLHENDGVTPIAETVTDESGLYLFDQLPPGDYVVVFDLGTLPTGTIVSPVARGGDRERDSDADPATGRTAATGHLASGVHRRDLDLGIWTPGRIGDTVWIDINNNGRPDDENLAELGIDGVRVELHEVTPDGGTRLVGETVTATSDGAMGQYLFDNLPPGTYEVRVNRGDVPPQFATETTPLAHTVTLDGGDSHLLADFGFNEAPTAIELVSFGARLVDGGVRVEWTTGWEKDTLGYFVHRVAADGRRVRINQTPVLAAGAGAYELLDEGATGGRYVLEEIDAELNAADQGGPTIAVADAAPLGGEVLSVMAQDGEVVLGTTADYDSYLAVGFEAVPEVFDLTDPDRPLRLEGEVLETDGGAGVYFSAPADRLIEIR